MNICDVIKYKQLGGHNEVQNFCFFGSMCSPNYL